jgi:hypothetical protein
MIPVLSIITDYILLYSMQWSRFNSTMY